MRRYKPDPYNGFKCDSERRRALNTRVICMAIVGVSFALSAALSNVKSLLTEWLS